MQHQEQKTIRDLELLCMDLGTKGKDIFALHNEIMRTKKHGHRVSKRNYANEYLNGFIVFIKEKICLGLKDDNEVNVIIGKLAEEYKKQYEKQEILI